MERDLGRNPDDEVNIQFICGRPQPVLLCHKCNHIQPVKRDEHSRRMGVPIPWAERIGWKRINGRWECPKCTGRFPWGWIEDDIQELPPDMP